MKDDLAEYLHDPEEQDGEEKLDDALREMEIICRSRCVDVPLTTNVKVVDLENDEESKTGYTP